MTAFDRRPAGTFASAFYIFACVFYCVGYSTRTVLTPILFAAFAAVLLFSGKIPFRRSVCAVTAGMLAAALFSCAVVDIRIASEKIAFKGEKNVICTVVDVQYRSSWSGIYTVDSEDGKFILRCDDGELDAGDIIGCKVRFCENDDEYLEYTKADGVFASAEAEDEIRLVGYDKGPSVSASKMRERLSAKLRSSMSDKSGGFAAAILLGDKSELSDEIKRDFRTLGISHILALSGTHLSVLFYAVSKLIPDKRRFIKLFTVCPLVLLYMMLTGFSASVTRAGIMFIIGAVGSAFNKKTDSFTSLSVSVALMCLFDCYAPFDVGLQLSYASVIGLIISNELRRGIADGKNAAWRKISGKVIPAFAVPSVVLPLMWLRFGTVSLVSPVSNILLVPASMLIVPICAVIIAVSEIPGLFATLSVVSDVLISGYLNITEYFAKTAGPTLSLAGDAVAILVLLYSVSVLAAVLFEGKLRRITFSLSCVLICASLISAQWYYNRLNDGITVCYSSKKTDEALSVACEGYNILIDMGMYPSATEASVRAGSVYGSDRIDALFITDPHVSHRLTITKICENYYLSSLWLPAADNENDRMISLSLADEAKNMGVCVYTYIPGETLYIGECEFVTPLSGHNDSDRREVAFSLKRDGKILRYSNRDQTIGCGADVHIVGIHDAENKGALALDGFDEKSIAVISPQNAASFDSIPECAYVTELGAVHISLGDGHGAYPIPIKGIR